MTIDKQRLVLPYMIIIFVWLMSAMVSGQSWEYSCLQGSEVEILGKGMGTNTMVIENPVTIAINNASEVDSIIAQVMLKVTPESEPPQKVEITTEGESIEFLAPTLTTVGAAWYYECKLAPSSFVRAEVVGEGSDTYKSPRALTVYVFRKNGIGKVEIGKLMHMALWWHADDRPATHQETFAIPTGSTARDIRVTFVITDKDGVTDRNLHLHAQAGSVQQEVYLLAPTHGEELLIYTLTLPNVPASVTSLTATVTSPQYTGDSVYWTGIDIQIPCEGDLGDAPDPPFPVLLANQGAFHYYRPNFFLGSLWDSELDGQPSALADGDDLSGIDDEDGVVFTSQLVQGLPATVDVTATAPGVLNAWIDFENNGTWADAIDHIFHNTALNAGVNHLSFMVPITYKPNVISACRFRFSSALNLSYTGSAIDGEVEDYVVDVYTPVELTSFSASTQRNRVVLEWTTQSEIENLGFNIFRSECESGPFVQINSELIRGAGNSTGRQSYRYIDYKVESHRKYHYQLASISNKGTMQMQGSLEIELKEPNLTTLDPNVPNPFNNKTRISYSIKDKGSILLAVYNLQGQRVRTLINQTLEAGTYSVLWDGRNENGIDLPSGTYLCILKTSGGEWTRRMTLVR